MRGALVLIALCACAAVQAADAPVKPVAATAQRSSLQALTAIGPVALRGQLADAKVQVNLRFKADIADGVEGDYFLFGRSQKILLAGEIDADELALEESENGTDVSGQWNGTFDGKVLSGTWQSADGSVSKPFELTVVTGNGKPVRHQLKASRDSK
jgi:hypothetical protein